MSGVPSAFFVPAANTPPGGYRLYLHHTPPAGEAVRAAVLYVHPWAEEMNKSRRMAALASRGLAAGGCAVLQVDLLGCGDSSGDFGDASWDAWLSDIHQGLQWLRAHHPDVPLWIWGLRVGALLAAEAASRIDEAVHLLLWQPTVQGKTAWQQFLRLKAAGQLADGDGKAVLAAARTDLAAGRAIVVGGYAVSPALARGLESSALTPVASHAQASGGCRLVWLEISAQPEPAVSPAATMAVPRWQVLGWATQLKAVSGPSFWQTVEIEDAPDLVAATLEALST